MKRCALDGIDVAYEEFGEGRPILFLHGWSLDHTCEIPDFEPIFEARPGWRRIYLDLPGHGRTPGSERINSMDDILELILAFMDALVPAERLAIAGTSAGALPARGVVYRRPEQVCGLLMRIPLIIADDAKRTVPEPTVVVKDESFMARLTPAEQADYDGLLVQNERFYKFLKHFVEEVILPAQARGDSRFLEKIQPDPKRYGLSFDVDALQEPFGGPSLFLAGRQDPTVGYQDIWPTLDNYPRATYAVLDRAGHWIPNEDPALFRALVNDWLDRVEEYEAYRHKEL